MGEVQNISTISDLTRKLGLATSHHPLITLLNYDELELDLSAAGTWLTLDLYKISFKKDYTGTIKYGSVSYDFENGGMAFLAPGQIVQMNADREEYQGYALYFHPDLLVDHALARNIHHYGFFDYTANEALILNEDEMNAMMLLFQSMKMELDSPVDQFHIPILVSQIELLLNQSNRYYNRQFQVRKSMHHELIEKMDAWMNDYFESSKALTAGLPSPQNIAADLNVSQRYLSDMLKNLTGKTTQQQIHSVLIERAKLLLIHTDLSNAQIAYRLGFEHPQSFNKLFKQHTNTSPGAFRRDQLA